MRRLLHPWMSVSTLDGVADHEQHTHLIAAPVTNISPCLARLVRGKEGFTPDVLHASLAQSS